MQSPIKAETRTYLAHLISEMLSIQDLPTDLREALTSHLHSQFNQVNLLKPEYCRRLYPILLELSELEEHQSQLFSVASSGRDLLNGPLAIEDPLQDNF